MECYTVNLGRHGGFYRTLDVCGARKGPIALMTRSVAQELASLLRPKFPYVTIMSMIGGASGRVATKPSEIDAPMAPAKKAFQNGELAPSVLKPCSTPTWLQRWVRKVEPPTEGISGADTACDGDFS